MDSNLPFGIYNNLSGTLRTDINLAGRTCKTIAAGTIDHVPLKGASAFMTEYDLNQFIHTADDSL